MTDKRLESPQTNDRAGIESDEDGLAWLRWALVCFLLALGVAVPILMAVSLVGGWRALDQLLSP